jgi:hypothetical protein
MKSKPSNGKRIGAVFGILFLSELLIFVFGGVVPSYTEVTHGDSVTSIEGAFASFAPTTAHPPFSILDLLGYMLGLGSSGALLLASVPFGLSFVAAGFLAFSSTVLHSSSQHLRHFVVAVYSATPILAATVVSMLVYAVSNRSPTSPNQALQRTAPGVTAHAPTTCAPAAFPHGLRRPPQSLSLGSLGVSSRSL